MSVVASRDDTVQCGLGFNLFTPIPQYAMEADSRFGRCLLSRNKATVTVISHEYDIRIPSKAFFAGVITWHDAMAAAATSDPLWVVTSPNMHYIPAPCHGHVDVVLRTDYRYGWQDPIQWPQMFTTEYPYLASILRQPVDNLHAYAPIWWTPDRLEFDIIEGSVITCLGLIRKDRIYPLCRLVEQLSAVIVAHPLHSNAELSSLEVAMRHASDRLRHFPCTWRDACLQVRQVQRYWLMTRAFLDFHTTSTPPLTGRFGRSDIMGAFTTDPSIVQILFEAGIPVWWLRMDVAILKDTNVRAVVSLDAPENLCQDVALDAEVLYSGLVGPKHLRTMLRNGHTYRDISRAVLFAVDTDRGYCAPLSQKQYKSTVVAQHATGSTPSSRPVADGGRNMHRPKTHAP